jgi:hypothetical protein
MKLSFCRPFRTTRQYRTDPKTRYVGGWTLEQFLRENLPVVMANLTFVGHSPKRIRKKRAKNFLFIAFREHRWQYLGELMAAPIRERWDYVSIGRQVFHVEQIPSSGVRPFGL